MTHKLSPAQTAVRKLNTDLKQLKASKVAETKQLKSIATQEQHLVDSFAANPTLTEGLTDLAKMFALGVKRVQTVDSFTKRIAAEKKTGIALLKKAEPAISFKTLNHDRHELGLKALKHPPPSMQHHGADAIKAARSVLGHNISQLKYHGPLKQYLDKWPGNNVCCANFVSACLEKAKLIRPSEHSDRVSTLAHNLAHDKNWHRVSSHQMKPGDVVCFDVPGEGHFAHTVMFEKYQNGRAIFIGSNNANADGTQRITQGPMGYAIDAVYRHKG